MAMTPEQQQVLAQIGRPGWTLVGTRPETKKVQTYDANNRSVETDQSTGNEVWSIVSPSGQPDEITVQQHFGPEEQPGYTVLKGPSNTPTAPARSQVPAGFTNIQDIRNADSTTTKWGNDPKDGVFKPIPGVPNGAPATPAKPTPTAVGDYQPFKGPDGRIIAYVDPKDPTNRIPVPQDQADRLPDGTTKDTFEAGGRKVTWISKGGQWTVQTIGDPAPQVGQPTNGQTRRVVSGDYIVTEVYNNGVWSVDKDTPPARYIPTDKPNEGDIRPNVKDGQQLQEVYRGGQWVIDPSVPPRPFGPQTPQAVSAPTTQPNIVTQTPGQPGVQTITNPNYQASDIAGRVTQLKQQATTKRDELNQQVVSGQKTKEQAASEFDAWWSANIDPFSSQLQQQQAQQQQDSQIKANQEARAQQAADQSTYSTAQQAGQNAAQRTEALLPYMVGPGYGAAVNNIAGAYASGKAPQGLDIGSAVTFQAPDLNAIAEQATAQALAHLSPTAAGKAGQPLPQIPPGLDIQSALNKSNYAPTGGTTTIAPDGTVTIQHQPQQQQSLIPNYVPNGAPGPARGLDYALPPMSF